MQSWEGAEFVEATLSGPRCRLRSTVRRLLRQRRFSLIHSQGLTAGVEAVLANLGHGIPHVVTSHDVIRPDQFSGLRGRCKRRALGEILGRSHALVAVSNDARQNHLRYLPALERGSCRVVTILNGVDTARYGNHDSPQGPSLRKRLGLPENVYLLGFLGRFMEQKGFLLLVDALERLAAAGQSPQVRLLAVGSGDYVREYREEIARRPAAAGCITMLEHTPDVTPILREIDLLVMPSLWEACPLLPMEAMCAGTPVLGSDCIGLREVLFGSPSRMVPAGDAAALAQGIGRARESPWRERAAEYAPLARQRFDVHRGAGQLLRLFDQFVTQAENATADLVSAER
jgi:glycosyltransferase involved in cell wall biosynthesis